jgi:hypothetical protein
LEEIGYRGSVLYTVNDIDFKKKIWLAPRLNNKVKTSVNSISFMEGSLRTTRDHHYIEAYPQAGEPRTVYSLKGRTRRQRSRSSGWLAVQIKTIHLVPLECLENQEEIQKEVYRDNKGKFAGENIHIMKRLYSQMGKQGPLEEQVLGKNFVAAID